MRVEFVEKGEFSVIGKEGSTESGAGFVRRLWNEANAHFVEVAPLAKKNAAGFAGAWGLMSDFSRKFLPWTDGFSKGLYLAGIECCDEAEAPRGWTKWTCPAFKFLKILRENEGDFQKGLQFLREKGLSLVGAVQDFTDLQTKSDWIFFPVERL